MRGIKREFFCHAWKISAKKYCLTGEDLYLSLEESGKKCRSPKTRKEAGTQFRTNLCLQGGFNGILNLPRVDLTLISVTGGHFLRTAISSSSFHFFFSFRTDYQDRFPDCSPSLERPFRSLIYLKHFSSVVNQGGMKGKLSPLSQGDLRDNFAKGILL